MGNNEISIRKAAVIGLFTGFALVIIGIGLAFIWEVIISRFNWYGQNTIIGKMFVGTIFSMAGAAMFVWIVITEVLRIHNIVVIILMCFVGQGLLGMFSGILLAIVSKKSCQLKNIWFGVRVVEILMVIGIILTLLLWPNVT